jgi:hypothetical protein
MEAVNRGIVAVKVNLRERPWTRCGFARHGNFSAYTEVGVPASDPLSHVPKENMRKEAISNPPSRGPPVSGN